MNRAAWCECGVTGIFATDSSEKANLDLVSEIIICSGSSFLLDTGAERLFMRNVAPSLSVYSGCEVNL